MQVIQNQLKRIRGEYKPQILYHILNNNRAFLTKLPQNHNIQNAHILQINLRGLNKSLKTKQKQSIKLQQKKHKNLRNPEICQIYLTQQEKDHSDFTQYFLQEIINLVQNNMQQFSQSIQNLQEKKQQLLKIPLQIIKITKIKHITLCMQTNENNALETLQLIDKLFLEFLYNLDQELHQLTLQNLESNYNLDFSISLTKGNFSLYFVEVPPQFLPQQQQQQQQSKQQLQQDSFNKKQQTNTKSFQIYQENTIEYYIQGPSISQLDISSKLQSYIKQQYKQDFRFIIFNQFNKESTSSLNFSNMKPLQEFLDFERYNNKGSSYPAINSISPDNLQSYFILKSKLQQQNMSTSRKNIKNYQISQIKNIDKSPLNQTITYGTQFQLNFSLKQNFDIEYFIAQIFDQLIELNIQIYDIKFQNITLFPLKSLLQINFIFLNTKNMATKSTLIALKTKNLDSLNFQNIFQSYFSHINLNIIPNHTQNHKFTHNIIQQLNFTQNYYLYQQQKKSTLDFYESVKKESFFCQITQNNIQRNLESPDDLAFHYNIFQSISNHCVLKIFEKQFQQFSNHITTQKNNNKTQFYIIRGEQGSGKSVFLYRIQQFLLKQSFNVVLLDSLLPTYNLTQNTIHILYFKAFHSILKKSLSQTSIIQKYQNNANFTILSALLNNQENNNQNLFNQNLRPNKINLDELSQFSYNIITHYLQIFQQKNSLKNTAFILDDIQYMDILSWKLLKLFSSQQDQNLSFFLSFRFAQKQELQVLQQLQYESEDYKAIISQQNQDYSPMLYSNNNTNTNQNINFKNKDEQQNNNINTPYIFNTQFQDKQFHYFLRSLDPHQYQQVTLQQIENQEELYYILTTLLQYYFSKHQNKKATMLVETEHHQKILDKIVQNFILYNNLHYNIQILLENIFMLCNQEYIVSQQQEEENQQNSFTLKFSEKFIQLIKEQKLNYFSLEPQIFNKNIITLTQLEPYIQKLLKILSISKSHFNLEEIFLILQKLKDRELNQHIQQPQNLQILFQFLCKIQILECLNQPEKLFTPQFFKKNPENNNTNIILTQQKKFNNHLKFENFIYRFNIQTFPYIQETIFQSMGKSQQQYLINILLKISFEVNSFNKAKTLYHISQLENQNLQKDYKNQVQQFQQKFAIKKQHKILKQKLSLRVQKIKNIDKFLQKYEQNIDQEDDDDDDDENDIEYEDDDDEYDDINQKKNNFQYCQECLLTVMNDNIILQKQKNLQNDNIMDMWELSLENLQNLQFITLKNKKENENEQLKILKLQQENIVKVKNQKQQILQNKTLYFTHFSDPDLIQKLQQVIKLLQENLQKQLQQQQEDNQEFYDSQEFSGNSTQYKQNTLSEKNFNFSDLDNESDSDVYDDSIFEFDRGYFDTQKKIQNFIAQNRLKSQQQSIYNNNYNFSYSLFYHTKIHEILNEYHIKSRSDNKKFIDQLKFQQILEQFLLNGLSYFLGQIMNPKILNNFQDNNNIVQQQFQKKKQQDYDSPNLKKDYLIQQIQENIILIIKLQNQNINLIDDTCSINDQKQSEIQKFPKFNNNNIFESHTNNTTIETNPQENLQKENQEDQLPQFNNKFFQDDFDDKNNTQNSIKKDTARFDQKEQENDDKPSYRQEYSDREISEAQQRRNFTFQNSQPPPPPIIETPLKQNNQLQQQQQDTIISHHSKYNKYERMPNKDSLMPSEQELASSPTLHSNRKHYDDTYNINSSSNRKLDHQIPISSRLEYQKQQQYCVSIPNNTLYQQLDFKIGQTSPFQPPQSSSQQTKQQRENIQHKQKQQFDSNVSEMCHTIDSSSQQSQREIPGLRQKNLMEDVKNNNHEKYFDSNKLFMLSTNTINKHLFPSENPEVSEFQEQVYKQKIQNIHITQEQLQKQQQGKREELQNNLQETLPTQKENHQKKHKNFRKIFENPTPSKNQIQQLENNKNNINNQQKQLFQQQQIQPKEQPTYPQQPQQIYDSQQQKKQQQQEEEEEEESQETQHQQLSLQEQIEILEQQKDELLKEQELIRQEEELEDKQQQQQSQQEQRQQKQQQQQQQQFLQQQQKYQQNQILIQQQQQQQLIYQQQQQIQLQEEEQKQDNDVHFGKSLRNIRSSTHPEIMLQEGQLFGIEKIDFKNNLVQVQRNGKLASFCLNDIQLL